jgi:predicted MPP superfamily phosphohydrolase
VGQYRLVISRGIGLGMPVPRFLNNPEIVCVTLNKA